MKHNKFREWISIQMAKKPRRIVLSAIFLFNIAFIFISALIISSLSLDGTEKMGFLEAAFCTLTMIMDAGCVEFVIADIGQAGVAISIICLIIILIGSISFMGAIIGYVTNYISTFVSEANEGSRRLNLAGHTVILNWNTRASEIINDMLYFQKKYVIVVLVSGFKEEIVKEIEERLADTVERENDVIRKRSQDMNPLSRFLYRATNKFKNEVTVIVREGDVFSSKQLNDVSLSTADSVIILSNELSYEAPCPQKLAHKEEYVNANPLTVKTLMQVSEITSNEASADNQRIIVEITDNWTGELVDKIISCKQKDGKCNIVPIPVNKVLGQILSQFSIMPELNLVYRELFSNKGAEFYSKEQPFEPDEDEYVRRYLENHYHAIPLTQMNIKGKNHFYYTADYLEDISKEVQRPASPFKVDIKKRYRMENKNIIILGHNSKCNDIMEGFKSFIDEWGNIVKVIVIDNDEYLAKQNYYSEYRIENGGNVHNKYGFIADAIAANIYDQEGRKIVEDVIKKNIFTTDTQFDRMSDTSILILSDDSATSNDIDANALTHLIHIKDIINEKVKEDPDFDVESVDIIVEIIDPKHHDVVKNYSENNVVISNRYISKMITQVADKDSLYDFYNDILTYDSSADSRGQAQSVREFESKEVYAKKVSEFFNTIPPKCKASELVRAIYNASIDPSVPVFEQCPTIMLGYVKHGGNMVLFSGDQSDIEVELEDKDKIIVFTNH